MDGLHRIAGIAQRALAPVPVLAIGAASAITALSNQTLPSPGGQVSGMASQVSYCGAAGAVGVASPRLPKTGLPHVSPGAEPGSTRFGCVEGCPRADVWSGGARSTGCPTSHSVSGQGLSVNLKRVS